MFQKIQYLVLLAVATSVFSCGDEDFDETGSNADLLSYKDSYEGNGNEENLEDRENYKEYGENPFVSTSIEPISTFGVDADGASYANMRRFVNNRQKVPPASVRVEEYVNYFTYDYHDPTNENIALNSELSTCPWNSEHHLLRIGIKGKSMETNEIPGTNYVFLIDVSGSMSSSDKLPLLKSGLRLMIKELRPIDKVAIVTYAGSVGVKLPSTSGDEEDKILAVVNSLRAGGGTSGEAGLKVAYDIAEENFIEGGNNRIILGTDGDFNIGSSNVEDLKKLAEEKRKTGVFITVLGFGTGNLNDHLMEQVANTGNGNYEYIDNSNEIKKVFIHERSKFYSVAKDSKVQLTFDSTRVKKYRLIGYENRALKTKDFENDSIDAGEIGAGQTITALYELKLTDQGLEIGNLEFRYKYPNEGTSSLISHSVTSHAVDIESGSSDMKFCSAVAAFGMLMKQSNYAGNVSKAMILELAENGMDFDPNGDREEFVRLVKKAL